MICRVAKTFGLGWLCAWALSCGANAPGESQECALGGLRTTQPVAPVVAERPALQTLMTTPAYGVCMSRVSDHIAHDDPAAVHLGARHQAFNADESTVMLRSRQVMRLSDSAFVGQLPQADSVWVWSPTQATKAYAFTGTQLQAYDYASASLAVIRDFAGPYERLLAETSLGEVSRGGRRLVVAAHVAAASGGGKVLLQIDPRSGEVVSATPIAADNVQRHISPRWLQALPLGQGFLAGWPRAGVGERFAGVELFNDNGEFVRQIDAADEGGDVALDPEGAQWFVHLALGHGKDARLHHLVKTPLTSALGAFDGGASQALLALPVAHHAQISCTAWGQDSCVVAINQADATQPLDGEIVRVFLHSQPHDPQVQRLVQHQSVPQGVFQHSLQDCPLPPAVVLPQPSLDRAGRRVLFSSNWGPHCFAELYMLRLE